MADDYGTTSAQGLGGATVRPRGDDGERGIGWVMFAGMMLAIIGILNLIIYGLVAYGGHKGPRRQGSGH